MKTNFILVILYYWVICFSSNNAISQSESIRITQEGLQFNDGTEEFSASPSNNPGSNINWNVYVEYSNGIQGDIVSPPYENHSLALRVHHELYRDLNASGLPENVQHHRALLLKKDIDKASTSLYAAFNNNLVIDQIILKFTRVLTGGVTGEKFRITLNNAKIVEIQNDLIFDSETSSFKGTESLRLVYQNMTVQHFTPNNTVTLIYQY